MREIKFRGICIKCNKWLYGFYYEHNGRSLICSEYHSNNAYTYINDEVKPETVGQFAELKDKNGKEIYEGDHFGNPVYPVVFHAGCFMLGGMPLIGYLNGEYAEQVTSVDGNIHEKPDFI